MSLTEILGSSKQIEAKRVGKGRRETVERDDEPGSVGWTGIPSGPLFPGQTPMCALRSSHGRRELHRGRRRIGSSGAFHPDGLAPNHFEPGAPDTTAGPVFPQDGSQRQLLRCWSLRRRGIRASSALRPQHRTHSARFARGAALLTLCPQRTGAAMADACGIQDPQGAIALLTSFLRIEGMVGRAAQCAIRLRSKRGAGKASGERRTCPVGRAIADRRRGDVSTGRLNVRSRLNFKCWGKFCNAQLCRREGLSQF